MSKVKGAKLKGGIGASKDGQQAEFNREIPSSQESDYSSTKEMSSAMVKVWDEAIKMIFGSIFHLDEKILSVLYTGNLTEAGKVLDEGMFKVYQSCYKVVLDAVAKEKEVLKFGKEIVQEAEQQKADRALSVKANVENVKKMLRNITAKGYVSAEKLTTSEERAIAAIVTLLEKKTVYLNKAKDEGEKYVNNLENTLSWFEKELAEDVEGMDSDEIESLPEELQIPVRYME